MTPLPAIMVAPNGARLTRADHPALPVTLGQIVATVRACAQAGAGGSHLHVRDRYGAHVLDAGLYRELLAEIAQVLPGHYAQITTEAVGQYSPDQQRALVRDLRPAAVSIALREITADTDDATTARFFADCAESGVAVQHILYDQADIAHLAHLRATGVIPAGPLLTLIVLGRYTVGQVSAPSDLDAPLAALLAAESATDWAVCAFGARETACLVTAARRGGKCRIGFENNRLNADGHPAPNNAARVRELVQALQA